MDGQGPLPNFAHSMTDRLMLIITFPSSISLIASTLHIMFTYEGLLIVFDSNQQRDNVKNYDTNF